VISLQDHEPEWWKTHEPRFIAKIEDDRKSRNRLRSLEPRGDRALIARIESEAALRRAESEAEAQAHVCDPSELIAAVERPAPVTGILGSRWPLEQLCDHAAVERAAAAAAASVRLSEELQITTLRSKLPPPNRDTLLITKVCRDDPNLPFRKSPPQVRDLVGGLDNRIDTTLRSKLPPISDDTLLITEVCTGNPNSPWCKSPLNGLNRLSLEEKIKRLGTPEHEPEKVERLVRGIVARRLALPETTEAVSGRE